MADPIRPASTKVYGRTNWVLVPAFADPNAPKVSEMTAAGALDVTNILFVDGTTAPTQETNRVERSRRVGDTVVYEQIGDTKMTGGEFTYVLNPQAVAGSDGKKLFELIPEGTQMRLVKRLGVTAATAPAAGQFITSYPVEFGPSDDTVVGEGETSESAGKCAYAVNGPPSRLKALTV